MTNSLFDSRNVFRHISYLSQEIGPRVKGSLAERQAAVYIQQAFTRLGMSVVEQEFPVEYIVLDDFTVEIIEPSLGLIDCFPILQTPDTPDAGISAEIVMIEGPEDPKLGPQLGGKIILWFCSNIGDFDFSAIVKYHPAAVVAVMPSPGVKPRHEEKAASSFHPFQPVTCFWTTWEEGMRLSRGGARYARVHLQTRRKSSSSRNIIAKLPGSAYPDDIVVIGGHYDSPPGTPGATDNASGVGITLELARLFSQRGTKRTLHFAAWGCEEVRYRGSLHYLEDLVKQDQEQQAKAGFVRGRDRTLLDRHLLYLNLDVLGMFLGQNACHVLAPPEVETALYGMCNELGVPHLFYHDWYGSDHEPFVRAGIPAINFTREGPAARYIHTIDDSVDIVDPHQLQKIGNLVETFLKRTAADSETWPFERRVPECAAHLVKEKMERTGFVLDF